jgi:DNA-binding transcriptional ArsR family regulator
MKPMAFVFNPGVDNSSAPPQYWYSTKQLRKRVSDQLSKVFAALSDPLRRDMITRLTTADATVSQLAEPYDVSMQAISKHLKVLEDAGLVSRSRAAQSRPVHLEVQVFDLMTKWIERYQRQAEQRYQRLDAVLAAMNDTGTRPRRKGKAS